MKFWSSKTASRTTRFVARSLTWQGEEKPYALVVWAALAGVVWLLVDTAIGGLLSSVLMLPGMFLLLLVLFAICAIDARFGIIPDSLVMGLAAIGGMQLSIALLMVGDPGSSESGIANDLLSGILERGAEVGIVFAAAASLRAAYRCVRGRDGLGFGDVKLLTAGALWTGLSAIPLIMSVAVISAFLSIAILRREGTKLFGRDAIAFGPHLALGIWLATVFSGSN